MSLAIAGLATAGLGAGLQFAAGRKREKAVDRAQRAIEQATATFFAEKKDRQDAISQAFEELALRRGESVQDMLADRNSEARTRAGDLAREGSVENIANAQGILEKRLTPPPRASQPAAGQTFEESLAANMDVLQPDVDLTEQAINIGAARRGEAGFDREIQDRLGLELAALQDRATRLNVESGVTEAQKQNEFDLLMNRLGVQLNDANKKGGGLALTGALMQQGGLLATNIGAMRAPGVPGATNVAPGATDLGTVPASLAPTAAPAPQMPALAMPGRMLS